MAFQTTPSDDEDSDSQSSWTIRDAVHWRELVANMARPPTVASVLRCAGTNIMARRSSRTLGQTDGGGHGVSPTTKQHSFSPVRASPASATGSKCIRVSALARPATDALIPQVRATPHGTPTGSPDELTHTLTVSRATSSTRVAIPEYTCPRARFCERRPVLGRIRCRDASSGGFQISSTASRTRMPETMAGACQALGYLKHRHSGGAWLRRPKRRCQARNTRRGSG